MPRYNVPMTLLLDIPQARPSPLHRLDPRWKLAALVPAALACALVRTPGPALTALAGALALVALARLRLRWFLLRLGAALLMLTLFLLWLPFAPRQGHDVLDLGWFLLSLTGLTLLLVLVARAAC